MADLEYFGAWRMESRREMQCLPARRADAFVILQQEMKKENADG